MRNFSETAKWTLWDACNERGWFEWRIQYLDPCIQWPEDWTFARIDEEDDFKWMDQRSAADQRSEFMAHHWIDGRSKAGMTPRQLVDRARTYASTRQNMRAYTFFAKIVSEIGTRADVRSCIWNGSRINPYARWSSRMQLFRSCCGDAIENVERLFERKSGAFKRLYILNRAYFDSCSIIAMQLRLHVFA